jgi:hypothetical protein
MSYAVEVLEKLKERMVDPTRWVTGHYFADREGRPEHDVVWNPARCCIKGHLSLVCDSMPSTSFDDGEWSPEHYLKKASIRLYGEHSVIGVNDDYGWAAALHVTSEALKMAREAAA